MITELKYSLAIIFIHVCYQDGMIFSWLRRCFELVIGNGRFAWLNKPLHECVICMSGMYTIVFWITQARPINPVEIIKTVLIVGGINVVLSPFIEQSIFDFRRKATD